MYGGMILGLGASFVYIRVRRHSFWQVADTLIPPWTVLLVLGWIGCFLNGCCYGKSTSAAWGVFSRSAATTSGFYVATHPTQLYSAGAALGLFVILWQVRRRSRFEGQIGVLFFLLYSIGRFFIEYDRADPRGMWRFFDLFTLSESQILSIPTFVFGLVAWRILSRRGLRIPCAPSSCSRE